MHKELNAVKGGNSRMHAWWGKNGIEGPVLLMNKDNAAATSDKSKDRAVSVSTGGGHKVLDLAGAVFRYKDDKKGQQDSLRYYLEADLGFRIQWPDMSNMCYHSHGDAALKKGSHTLTNIENNIFHGFSCMWTKEELACFAFSITHPYMHMVCNATMNILDLGPIHVHVISHLRHLITNVDVVLAPSASYQSITLDEKPFECPKAFEAIRNLAQDMQKYPYLHHLLVEFLEGASETWVEHFTREFAPGGGIDSSTPSQRHIAFMKTTNDDNEGALGTVRTSLRHAPSMSIAHFNARFMYKKNQTNEYILEALGPEERKKLRKIA